MLFVNVRAMAIQIPPVRPSSILAFVLAVGATTIAHAQTSTDHPQVEREMPDRTASPDFYAADLEYRQQVDEEESATSEPSTIDANERQEAATDPWTLHEDEDPFAALEDEDFDIDWDDYTLETVYFADKPSTFQRFDIDKARSVEAIDTQQMREHGARNVEEAIAALTPWTPLPSTSASPGPLLVDGLNGSWVQVLIDGIPYTRTQTGRQGPYPDLGNIPVDPDQIERIDIYRGSGPGGTCGASGTIINMITKAPTQRMSGRVSLDGGMSVGGISRYGGRGSLTIPLGDAWALRANGGWTRHNALDIDGDNIEDRPQRTVDDVQLQALWRPDGEDRLMIGMRTFGTRQWVAPENAETELGDRTDQRGYAGDLRYKNADENPNRLTARISAEHIDHHFYKWVPWSGNTRTKADTTSLQLRTNLTWERKLGEHNVSTEFCHTMDFVERTGEAGSVPSIREQQFCIGARDEWKLSQVVTLEGSALGGYHDAMGARWGGNLASIFRVNQQHGFRLSFDAGQRVPTIEERYIDFNHAEVGYLLVGNQNLTAEEAFTGRAGWVAKTDNERYGAEISAYTTLLRNRIDPVVLNTKPFTYSYDNFGRGLSAGVDLAIRGNDIHEWFGFDFTYNFMPIAKDPDTGAELSMRSHHNLRLNLRGSWLHNKLNAWTSAGVRSRLLWSGPLPGDELNINARPPQHATFSWDAGISGNPHDDIWVGLTARNMTNYADKNWGPMPGFELLLTVEASLQGKARTNK